MFFSHSFRELFNSTFKHYTGQNTSLCSWEWSKVRHSPLALQANLCLFIGTYPTLYHICQCQPCVQIKPSVSTSLVNSDSHSTNTHIHHLHSSTRSKDHKNRSLSAARSRVGQILSTWKRQQLSIIKTLNCMNFKTYDEVQQYVPKWGLIFNLSFVSVTF